MRRKGFNNVYIHVPFCRRKCAYCTFYSLAGTDCADESTYLTTLEKEVGDIQDKSMPLTSVFIGGGTPNSLSAAGLRRLFTILHQYLTIRPGAEITIECNPEQITPAKIAVLAEGGVNRVSIGVQSFSAEMRRRIGRCGSVETLDDAVEYLLKEGFDNINFDLIYGLPGQTLRGWMDDLRRVTQYPVKHISTYALGVAHLEDARAQWGEWSLPGEQTLVQMWRSAACVLAPSGMQRYEVSNFALPGYECRHNWLVWDGDTYAGCGPSASSFDGFQRWRQPADFGKWWAGGGPDYDIIPAESRAAEMLAFGLRRTDGWSLDRFYERTGFSPWQIAGTALEQLAARGLVSRTDNRLKPTARGLLFADTIFEELI